MSDADGLPLPGVAATAGAILQLIREGHARTRSELIALTGLSRSTVVQRVNLLLAGDMLIERRASSRSNGGRPPTPLAFNEQAGVVLAADLGARHGRLAVCDLAGSSLAEHEEAVDIANGPEAVLEWVTTGLRGLLDEAGRSTDAVLAIGAGVPGPVDHAAGRPISPTIMPGWDSYPVADVLAEHFGTAALLDKDVNIMALGEHRAHLRSIDHLVFVKVATGIGAGVIVDGSVVRGRHCSAGDIGHIRAYTESDVLCTCGNRGCVGALASGSAVARQLAADGTQAGGARDVVALVKQGHPRATHHVRESGRVLGEALASVVSVLAPTAIVVGGEMAEAREPLLAGIRETVYQRSLPLATRELQILTSQLGPRAGIVGAATMAIEHALSPGRVDALLAAREASA
jgi:predicted NBD/HSP70 family sugar kinase